MIGVKSLSEYCFKIAVANTLVNWEIHVAVSTIVPSDNFIAFALQQKLIAEKGS